MIMINEPPVGSSVWLKKAHTGLVFFPILPPEYKYNWLLKDMLSEWLSVKLTYRDIKYINSILLNYIIINNYYLLIFS